MLLYQLTLKEKKQKNVTECVSAAADSYVLRYSEMGFPPAFVLHELSLKTKTKQTEH